MTFTLALVLFALISLVYLLVEVGYTYAHFGFGFGYSSNRPVGAERSPIGVRIQRTLQNQVETAAYAVPVLTVAAVTGFEGAGTAVAAGLFVLGRAAFGPLYWTGIPFIRIPAWGMGWISIAWIALAMLAGGTP